MINEETACLGKTRYTERRKARQVRQTMKGQGTTKGRLNIYICPFCGFLHLGHLPAEVLNGTLDKDEWRTIG